MNGATNTTLVIGLERRIRDALCGGRDTDTNHIAVTMQGDIVVLCGTVRTWAQHQNAGRIALAMPGVHAVDNRLALIVNGTVAQ